MFWSKLCKSTWNCAWNLAFPVFISPTVWNMCKNLHYESVCFKELHNEQEYYWSTTYRTGAAVLSTISSCIIAKLYLECKHEEHKTVLGPEKLPVYSSNRHLGRNQLSLEKTEQQDGYPTISSGVVTSSHTCILCWVCFLLPKRAFIAHSTMKNT